MDKKLGSYIESLGIKLKVGGKPYDYGGKIGKKNYTIVSAADAKIIGKRTLSFNSNGYVQTKVNNRRVDLQRYIASRKDGGLITGFQVDHKNRLRYDNSRSNLRQVSAKANSANRGVSKTGFVGDPTKGGGKKYKIKKATAFDKLQESIFGRRAKSFATYTRNFGSKTSADTKLKQSKAKVGKVFTKEHKANISKAKTIKKYKK